MSVRSERKAGIHAMAVRVLSAGFVLALASAGAGCDSGSAPAPEPAQPAAEEPVAPAAEEPTAPAAAGDTSARAEAEEIFTTRCQTCHGPEGAGDGPGAAALAPKPRNFQDPAFQEAVSDEHIANIIQFGGVAVGKSPTMPGNPDLASRPEVVEELVAVVRELGRS